MKNRKEILDLEEKIQHRSHNLYVSHIKDPYFNFNNHDNNYFMSFKDLQVQSLESNPKDSFVSYNGKENGQGSVDTNKDGNSEQESESSNVFEDTSKFGFCLGGDFVDIATQSQGKLTFREKNNVHSRSKVNCEPSDLNQDSNTKEKDISTPSKDGHVLQNTTDLQKKSSLVFRSGRREIIYFEDPDENSEYGDLAASIQNSSRVKNKRQKLTNPSDNLAQKIIEQLRQQGNEFDEKALAQSIELILKMPPS